MVVKRDKNPSIWWSLVPLVVLVAMLAVVISIFGSDAIMGGSQLALLAATSICVIISMGIYRQRWQDLEDAILKNIHTSASSILILLLIGAIAGTWMVSGVVPTLIYYGLKVLHPSIFLLSTCVICALVSLITGSSWTTIATIGVALMGIGRAMDFSEGWIAGAVISGAYFGDKMSMLSDTTVLASSTVKVPIFTHIRYMARTTLPSFVITIVVFTVAGFLINRGANVQTEAIGESLQASFNISPWLFIVPIITGLLIAKRLPAIITLFLSVVIACVAMVLTQHGVLEQIAGVSELNFQSSCRAVMESCYGSTAIETGNDELNALVETRGMAGMLHTVWLIICAMCFGGVMAGSGMLSTLTGVFLRHVKRATTTVTSTVGAGIFFNLTTADQYISIILTGNLFKRLYQERGFEMKLLSRSVEDSATLWSVLIPWNSCGMTKATV